MPLSLPNPSAEDWIAGTVVAWLVEQDPADLEAVATAARDVSGLILRQYRVWLPIGRALARPHMGAIRQADGATWERILDRVLARCPVQGMTCWRHKPWFFRQLDHVRDQFTRLDHGTEGP